MDKNSHIVNHHTAGRVKAGKDSDYIDKKQSHCTSLYSMQSQGWSKTMCTWTKTATLYITIQHAELRLVKDNVYMDKKQPHCTSPYSMQSRQAKDNVYMDKNSHTVHPRD